MDAIRNYLTKIGMIFGKIFYIPHLINSILVYIMSGYYLTGFCSVGKNSSIDKPRLIANPENITLGNNCSILKGAVITAINEWKIFKYNPKIIIGDNVKIGRMCHISAVNQIIIKDNVLIGGYVTISDNAHGSNLNLQDLMAAPADRPLFSKGPITINENVWIGDKVTIVSGVSIGKGSIIGANSVVTKDIPDGCICGGVPARILKILS